MKLSLMITGRELAEGSLLPRGWGHSYWLPRQDAAVVHPIPLNLVVRYAVRLWHWVRCSSSTALERTVRAAWRDGYENGRRDGKAGERRRIEQYITDHFERQRREREAQKGS